MVVFRTFFTNIVLTASFLGFDRLLRAAVAYEVLSALFRRRA